MTAGYLSSICFGLGSLVSLISLEATGFTGLALDTKNVSLANELKTISAYKRSLSYFIGWQCATAIVGIALEPRFAFELLLLCAANSWLVILVQTFKRPLVMKERIRGLQSRQVKLKNIFNQESMPPIGDQYREGWEFALSFIKRQDIELKELEVGYRAKAEWRILTGLQWGTTAFLIVSSFISVKYGK